MAIVHQDRYTEVVAVDYQDDDDQESMAETVAETLNDIPEELIKV
jgi:hypothetical protein